MIPKWMALGFCVMTWPIAKADAQVTTTPFAPENRPVKPFGYGTVEQQLVTSAGTTGTNWCQSWYGAQTQCVEVSGGNSCAASVPAGELVSCNALGTPPVNETAFTPIDCKGKATGPIGPLGSLDWCLTANLEPTRTTDTLYLFSDYVRVGVNRRFGGTIFELYGADELDRIMQNGGGAMQLSLWANDTTYAPLGSTFGYFAVPTLPNACNPTAYATSYACTNANPGQSCTVGLVGANDADCHSQFACGTGAGAPLNPIQAISAGCNYGQTMYSNNEAAVTRVTSPKPGVIAATKREPEQYTKSTPAQLARLVWTQTTQIVGPFASVSYRIRYPSGGKWNADYQELPAILTGQGMEGGYLYYYSGSAPYQNAASSVTRATAPVADTTTQVYQFPNRTGQFGVGVPPGYGAFLTEEWVSLCDATQTRCITVASFSNDAQDLIYGPASYAYFGVHGFFSLANGLDTTEQVYVAPYRFDDVVGGKTVRQWIYSLRGK